MSGVRVETESETGEGREKFLSHTPYGLVTPTRFARKNHSGASRPVNPILRQKTAAVLQSIEVLKIGRIITDK